MSGFQAYRRDDVLCLEGEMTIYSAAALKDSLTAAMAGELPSALDLSEVAEIDTAGVQLLLMADREARGRGTRLPIRAASESVKALLALYRLERLCERDVQGGACHG